MCVCVYTQKDRYLTAHVIMEAESPKSTGSRLENQEERVGVSAESEGRKKIHEWTHGPQTGGVCVLVTEFSYLVVSDSLWPHGLQHAQLPCPSPTPGAYSNSCPSSRWCHPTISSSVIPFSSCLQSFPSSGSFPMSQFFASGGQSIGVSASTSFLPMNIQD